MAGQRIAAKEILTPEGWRRDVIVEIGPDGRITGLHKKDKGAAADMTVGALLPAPGNVHSHAFQRAMAGLTEYRANPTDDFWSWRALMYHFVERLTPDDIEAIAAGVQMEMLEAGFAAVGEFHYLHHQPDGAPYANLAELSERLFAAAAETGIGYTHLPVLYMRGGMDGRALEGGQRRFGCTREQFENLFADAREAMKALPGDARLGVAPHSLRAVDKDGLAFAAALDPSSPVHIHIAEQTGEVEEAITHLGARPVEWLYANMNVDARWCLIHATHMNEAEVKAAAASGAVAGLCPITEANLGDGIFEAASFLSAGGRIGIGSDSNIRITLAEELRMLEHSQRLKHRQRAVLSTLEKSCGRFLLEGAALGGAQALGRDGGRIEHGALADFVALDAGNPALAGLSGDRMLDAWIFASAESPVTDVWSAGRHLVKDGRHIRRDRIAGRFNTVLARLRSDL
ncbi:formimidoylglutamate deiminase [Hyphococcus luteus]|uniref:Formimidoylglutamate deiminase n=1 Tax=Hyphococcus luteus TaxID=2058213 RepID=A0A2S7KAE9_9PROT|nr:formimidoylglutamate deiminase [Marinicaulis flavus]PQA89494.1 formimidoylglutamate deiminase [Marinicaulis flavus]